MSSLDSDEASSSMEVTTQESSIDENQENAEADKSHNLTVGNTNTAVADATVVEFDNTLPPGVAPDGFLIVDEELDSARPSPAAPIFKVTFRDDVAFQKYHKKIETFLKRLLLLQSKHDDDVKSSTEDLVLEIFDSNNSSQHSPKHEEKQPLDVYFTVDTKPKLKDDLDIPMYGKKFNKALEKSKEEKVPENKDYVPKLTCFNCMGNHNLRDCPEPRNHVAINKNRKDFYNTKGGPLGNSRYHLDEDQKFGHFIPGQLSSNLRKALNLEDDELPRHIYKMRILGYPPGWLEEARLQHSGLTLFNSDGVADQGSDEEGEIVNPGDKDQYDMKKIIDFPGFNVLPPPGTKDEWTHYWGTATQECNSKTAMVAYLSHKKADDGYKRKKLPNPAASKIRTDVNPGEMEIDSLEETSVECLPVKNLFIPPLPKEDKSDPPPPPPPLQTPPPLPPPEDSDSQSQEDNSNGASTLSSRETSPTLFDLEYAKKQLLAELNESTSSNPDSTKTGILTQESSNEVTNVKSSKTEVPELNTSQTENLNTTDVNNSTPKNNSKTPVSGSGHKSLKAVHLGTPILQSCSPYRSLPSSEKFSKDICDVINFENLPDATGKYDQMTELLQKVRRTLTELHKE